jgi:hypothetical protein
MLKIAALLLVAVTVCSAYPAPNWPYGYGGYPYNYWGSSWGYPYYGGYQDGFPYGYQAESLPYGNNRMVFYGEFPGE